MLKEKPFAFPGDKGIRVIIDTDCFNECDDQFAVAHALMTPRFDIKAIIAAQFGYFTKCSGTEQQSYDEIQRITKLMGLEGEVNVLHGADSALADEFTPMESEGARFIIEEAMSDDPRPLFVCSMGAVTNLASAYLLEPRIAGRFTAIWIGGAEYPDGEFEFNLVNDVNAARVLFKSEIELWQVPSNVYSTMKLSYFELLNNVYPRGELGKYLVERTMEFGREAAGLNERICNRSPRKEKIGGATKGAIATYMGGELWSIGDSPCIGLMMNSTLGSFHVVDAPCGLSDFGVYDLSRPGSRKIRVYDDIDSRFIINDMFEKLKFYFG